MDKLVNKYGFDSNAHRHGNFNHPWVSDVLFFAETHAIVYHYPTLKSISDTYFIPGMECFLMEPPNIMDMFVPSVNVTILRSNDVNVRLDFAAYRDNISPFCVENDINYKLCLDWQWKILAFQKEPKRLTQQWINAYKQINLAQKSVWGSGFFAAHWTNLWVPFRKFVGCCNDPISEQIKNNIDNNLDTFVKPMMMIFGYYLVNITNDSYVFEMTDVYPPGIYITVNNEINGKLAHKFGMIEKRIDLGERKYIKDEYNLYSHPWADGDNKHKFDWVGLENMNIEDRRVYLPKGGHINFVKKFVKGNFETFYGGLDANVFLAYLEKHP